MLFQTPCELSRFKNSLRRELKHIKDSTDIPYLELAEPEEGYHGLIKENETLVEVTPPIRARGPLCSFLILNNKHHGEAPFEIMVIDENEARLRVRFPLNCEKRRNYKFDIAAVGCDGSYSNTVPVHITVTDVNEFAPVFSEAAYVKAVDEGRIYDEILRVEATDRDCTPRYGDICKYEILTDRSQPFTIDNEGVIRNTEALDYEKSHNHILSVVAYDCGMLQSTPVMVTIKVNKPCMAGWKGVAERVDYAPGTGPLALFPGARLATCSSDVRCPGVTRIQAAVTLRAARAGGCDRDTYSLHAQRTICGLDPKTIDLLPSPGVGNEWAKSLKPDSGRDGEQMFEFDGETTAAIVPESVLPHSLPGSFSVSTWMRHAPPPDNDKHRKEHVLCLADDHKMNRHHYALFVRNCRLILLLRRDFGEGDLNIFRPAEWRWKLPEVCDDEWHHYAVNVRFPNVELFVDGEPYRALDGKGPEVIDDWPLHPAHGAAVTLRAARAGGCDRDTYSLHAQRTICGLDPKTIDLLPSPGVGNEWAKSLKPDSGRDGEQMFEFDGETTAAIVPESVLPHSLPGSFSVSTWMRHAPPPDNDKHRKEHVLCLADDHKMNRHHYALFVRNCRLILLLRRDFGEGDLNIFRPAEWRWKLPEVCDDEWHHYAVNVRFPNVELFVDGEPYRALDGKGPEVIDDWPLHPAHGVNTTLVIGACWQGTESDMKHHLRGWLAGLGVSRGTVQPPRALACLAHCREGLSLAPDLYLKSVSVEGDGVADVETLLRRVAYGDARAFPTPGRRNVHLTVVHPHMSGAGEAGLARELHPSGVADKMDATEAGLVPSISTRGADYNTLYLASYVQNPKKLQHYVTAKFYQNVLREIEYSNKKPAYYLNRVFKLTCSELNGRFTSNEYVQTAYKRSFETSKLGARFQRVGLMEKNRQETIRSAQEAILVESEHGHHGHALAPRVYAAHALRDAHAADVPAPRLIDLHAEPHAQNHVALLIGVVSCGVLVVVAGVALARARTRTRAPRAPARHSHALHELRNRTDAEMAWDDSALTITVNPMEEQAVPSCGTHAGADSSDGESCSDSDSDHHDSSDDDDEAVQCPFPPPPPIYLLRSEQLESKLKPAQSRHP
ncbi:hypothetical protein B5X24_HaOG206530 [Helicoverpa armigera]|uniref:Cadherin domain-containing protein n=1 Tax=Helicoverpa armigera TaxID=29058 RepID=A0A2W1BU07_HELAM|nr:hypothetical protein B5X24_HaOG206530 [Helicoverpa armigera]